MILYIVRHAIAVPHGTPGVAEDDRPLTPDGIKKMKKAAAGLKALNVAPDIIFTSPLPRAEQTAKIVAAALGSGIRLQILPSLAPSGKRSDIYREIQAHEEAESVMLVGHEPSLGEIAGEIAWGSAKHNLEFKKGGACAIDLVSLWPAPRGTLLWLLTPAILRQIST
ncbi:MAG: phosphohistidine phosphatase SixA [Acidobacteriota bacterium]